MLNARRIELYTLVLTGYKTSDGFYRLTPAQRRRVRRKEKAHDHPPDFACQRCRPGTLKDPVPAVAASTGPKTKWERD